MNWRWIGAVSILSSSMVTTRSAGARMVSALAPLPKQERRPRKRQAIVKQSQTETMQLIADAKKVSQNSSKATTSSSTQLANIDPKSFNCQTLLLELPVDVVIGELRCRPSKRNRSPYVADVFIEPENREAIVHVPNLDMGGKSVPGVKMLLKPARDKKGNLVGKDAVSPKYGTPKCEFIAQLLRVDESSLGYEPIWVGAHPNLGERIAEQLVERNLLGVEFPKVKSFQREVRNIAGTNMRADFVIQHEDTKLKPRILEVQTVVDTDYAASKVPKGLKCVFTSDKLPYSRTALFPWGQSNQKGPDGEKVVSARAIKHVQELTNSAQGKQHEGQQFDATILFIVIRHDAKAFRPNHEACPAFSRYLKQAKEAGVQVLAKQVRWGENEDIGRCFEGELLQIEWPE
jgi:DNA-binding sugar fermentation-stimulating protein